LTYIDYIMVIVAGTAMFGNGFFLVWAGKYTIMSHATIVGGLAAVLIIMIRLITCQRVKRLELIGTVLAIIGCFI